MQKNSELVEHFDKVEEKKSSGFSLGAIIGEQLLKQKLKINRGRPETIRYRDGKKVTKEIEKNG